MIKEGLVWIDEQPLRDSSSSKGVYADRINDDFKVYWFPSLMSKGNKENAEDLALVGGSL